MANVACCGHDDAKATFTRRTLVVISAPIFNSFKRIVPHVARERGFAGAGDATTIPINGPSPTFS